MTLEKKKGFNKFLEKTPDIRDLEIRERLNKFREKDEFFNRSSDNNNNSNNNNFIPRPPLPPPLSPQFPRQNFLPPPQQSPNLNDFFLDNHIPSPPIITSISTAVYVVAILSNVLE